MKIHTQILTRIQQFLSKFTNKRTDEHGGNIENSSRILFEILDEIGKVFSNNRIGIKFTPAAFNQGIIKPGESTIADYTYIFNKLNSYNFAYAHLVGIIWHIIYCES